MKIVGSYANKETGISSVTIATNLGTFEGIARCHPQDRRYFLRLSGYFIAQQRALLKYLKRQRQRLKLEQKGMLRMLDALYEKGENGSSSSFLEKAQEELDKMNLQLEQNQEKVSLCYQEIDEQIQNIGKYIEKRKALKEQS